MTFKESKETYPNRSKETVVPVGKFKPFKYFLSAVDSLVIQHIIDMHAYMPIYWGCLGINI